MKRSEYDLYTHVTDADADRKIQDLNDPKLWQATKSKYEGQLAKNIKPFEKLRGTPNLKSVFSNRLDPSVHGHRKKRDFITDKNIEKFYAKQQRRQIKVADEVKRNMIRKKEIAMEARDLQDLCRQFTLKATETLIQILDDPDAAPSAKLQAIGMLWDRGYGKPAQTQVNINASADSKPEELDAKSLDKRIADALGRVEKLANGATEEGESETRSSHLRKYN